MLLYVGLVWFCLLYLYCTSRGQAHNTAASNAKDQIAWTNQVWSSPALTSVWDSVPGRTQKLYQVSRAHSNLTSNLDSNDKTYATTINI